MSEQLRDALYERYCSWKDWSITAPARPDELEQFEIETRRAGFTPGGRLLEVGFGQGHFLDWARERGFAPLGVERVEAFVAAAKARGHEAYSIEEAPGAIAADSLDGVVAFDVFEHLTKEQLYQIAAQYARWLRPGGRILARFPNAASPFGRAVQHGDATHVSALTKTSVVQLFATAGFELVRAYDGARPWRRQRRTKQLVRLAAYGLRELVNTTLSLAYYGHRQPLDPNLTVVLQVRSR